MAKTQNQLLLKIEQGGQVIHRRLTRKDKISIGQSQKNDIPLPGKNLPKKHVLFAGKNNHFQVNINEATRGEVHAGESRLNIDDLRAHGLLPRQGKHLTYPITVGRKGVIEIADVKITFQCAQTSVTAAPNLPKFIGYSWFYATFRDLGRDLSFKFILFTMVALSGFLLRYMNGLPTEIAVDANARRIVPQRLARIIVKAPEAELEDRRSAAALGGTEESEEEAEDVKRERGEKSDRNVRPESMGLLGLLAGSGSSNQSNNLADFLLDKGLVEELDKVISSSDLSLGQGTSNRSEDFDNLIAQSTAGGGIDDILSGVADGIESVSFGEKGKIDVDRIGSMTGSESALGKRTEESVRHVLQRYTGRLTYIYNKHLKRDPEMRGKMVVEVEIAANGSVADVRLVNSSMNNPEFEREVLTFIRRWQYEAIDAGTVTVTYPLFFSRLG